MNSSERLYRLLPAIYRIRDYELRSPQKQDSQKDGPLEKFLLAIAQELQLLEGDIGDLYENWYIETCADWVVPYIGDLVGIPELYAASSSEIIPAGQRPYGIQERRAYVANTIAYRRRKGTASVLEQLARDVTGWGARVVEFWDLLALAQNLDHIRKQNKIVNLRSTTQLDLLGTPFESETAYTIQVRPTRSGNGRYNVPHIGLYIWRLSSYPIQRGTARLVTNNLTPQLIGRCYTFSPLENSKIQLFNRPATETEITQLAEEINLPIPLPRRPNFEGYQGKNPVLQIFINGQSDPIPPEEVLITTLGKPSNKQEESNGDDWLIPIPSSSQRDEPSQRTKIVAVDPQSGRIEFLDRSLPQRVEVSYSYGFSGDIGGGPYEREDDIPQLPTAASNSFSLTWEIDRAKSASVNPLGEAIQSWNGTLLAWQGLLNKICIPLKKITIDPINVISLPRESKLQSFQAGIIKGLKVIAIPGTAVAVVTPGRAIDGKGRAIAVNCSSSLDLSQMNPEGAPQKAIRIVVSYRAGRDNTTWQFNLIPVKEFLEHSDRYPDNIYLTLAYLVLNERSEILEVAAVSSPETVPSLPPRREFSPGKIRGLKVLTPPGALEAIVAPGLAVDDKGRVILLSRNTAVSLKKHQGKRVWLVIFYPPRSTQQTYQLDFIADADAQNLERYPETTYLRLAKLEVPTIGINLTQVNVPTTATQKNTEKAVVVKGLQVNIGNNLGEIIVRQGKAIDGQGNTITLKQDYHLDLTSAAGQTLTLFISQQKNLGWQPLKVISPTNSSEDWQQLGIVPEQPEKLPKGFVVIRDNATYLGDLSIKIPADRQLTIMAANGHRPHILGNISVQGIAAVKPSQNNQIIEQGELTLNGLLIEGKLAVAPGNLRWLNLSHCTLVPQQGGLIVYSSPANIDAEEGETWTLIALAIYCLNLIGKLIQIGFKSDRQSPQKLLTQLNQLAYQEAQRIFLILQQILSQRQNRNSPQTSILERCFSPGDSDIIPVDCFNSRLEITILRSICGAIQLTDTIPKLEITDSVIDRGSQIQGSTAIAAPQTQVKIATTTVLGSTTAGRLEASDSIFNEQVTVTRRQKGCVRFCYVPDGSQTPPRYQCQPDLILEEELDPLPKAIASLAIEMGSEHIYAGTAGDGIYHSTSQREDWIKIQNPEISQQHITSLIAYTDLLGQNNIFAGTNSGEVWFSQGNIENWQQINTGFNNTAITSIVTYALVGTGTISSAAVANNSERVQIIGNKTTFTKELTVGDTITAAEHTGTVLEILSDTELNIDRPFPENLPPGTTFKINQFLAGTSGNGVFLFRQRAQNWHPFNLGLTNLNITALALGKNQQIFAGTAGGGVFRFSTSRNGWEAINCGLTDLQVTTIAIDEEGTIFVGTEVGGVFVSTDNGDRWSIVDGSPINLKVTALIAYSPKGIEPRLIVATAGGGIFTTTSDRLDQQETENLSLLNITTMVKGLNNQQIFAGTSLGSILASQDHGVTWIPRDRGFVNVEQKLTFLAQLQPNFTSKTYGTPGYAQLGQACPPQIYTGAEDGSEMGVFSYLKHPQRQQNLHSSLDDYLRFGLEKSIFYIT